MTVGRDHLTPTAPVQAERTVMKLLLMIAMLMALPLFTSAELTITLDGLRPAYSKQDGFVFVTATVTDAGTPVPGATIVFSIYNPDGVLVGQTNPTLTRSDGTMTCTFWFYLNGPNGTNTFQRGTWTINVTAEKDGLSGSFDDQFEMVNHL